ncbi:MAG: hypothetical protein ACE5ES_00500 [Candidatus Nanoarchaeia archaeon]
MKGFIEEKMEDLINMKLKTTISKYQLEADILKEISRKIEEMEPVSNCLSTCEISCYHDGWNELKKKIIGDKG